MARNQSESHLSRNPIPLTWWRHQMETFSALLAICAGNSPVTGEFPAQRPMTRSFDVFFDLRMNKRLSKQWWGWWFETPPRILWCHCYETWHDILIWLFRSFYLIVTEIYPTGSAGDFTAWNQAIEFISLGLMEFEIYINPFIKWQI